MIFDGGTPIADDMMTTSKCCFWCNGSRTLQRNFAKDDSNKKMDQE